MSIFIGSSELSEAYVGSTEVQEIWVGSDQVWTSLPDISSGTYTLSEQGNSSFFGFLTDPTQTSTTITLYHGFYNSGSFFLVTQRASKDFTLKAGNYRLHFTLSNELSHPDNTKSTLTVRVSGSGTSGSTDVLVDGADLSAGAKTFDFTQNSEATVTLRFDSGLITGGTSGTDDRRISISSIYLEKL